MIADREVPALIVKIGHYPLHSGGVGAIRTLGRLGVPVYAISEDAFTPAALSRYCAGHFQWRPTAQGEDLEELVANLQDIGRRIGGRSVAIPTDDEAAILIAEHADELAEWLLTPKIRPDLPRQLASKAELYRLCCRYGVPTPESVLISTAAEAADFAGHAVFPVVVKVAQPWARARVPELKSTAIVRTPAELLALARAGRGSVGLLAQEYIPLEHAEDWIVHLYNDANANSTVLFTGVKVRSWPPRAGSTSCAYAVANPDLAHLAERFCKEIGFQGIADLDWRLDRRDGQYKLVDFNPRMGNQFRLFQTTAGIDVVRALYLDMTRRRIPGGEQLSGRRIVVEHFDLGARLARRNNTHIMLPVPSRAASTEWAWAARDDPVPFFAMWLRMVRPLGSYLAHMIRGRWGRTCPGA